MMPKIIDLRPKKNLLNPDFEKYQFSSEIVPIIGEKDLSKHVFRKEPSAEQESWLEARLFAFHNHLFKNPFDATSWFYDENYQVWQFKKDGTLNLMHSFNEQKDVKSHHQDVILNPTIAFASGNIVVLTRIDNNLNVILTLNNSERKTYQINDVEPGVLLDARYIQDKSQLIIAMCCIIVGERGKKQSKLVLLSHKLKKDDENSASNLDLIKKQELIVNGPIEYVYIEANGNFINLLSHDTAKFTFDSVNKIKTEDETNQPDCKESAIKIPKYSWSQDEDSLTIWIKIPQKYSSNTKPKVIVTSNTLSVTIDDETLVQGQLQFRIDHETAVWNREQDTLKLELMKRESGQMWSELILNDNNGECLPNEALAAEIHARLSHLCTDQQGNNAEQPAIGFNSEQLEECDLEGGDNTLQRIDLITHSTTHLAMLGAHNRILFTQKLESCQVLCSRHDHDGCVWKSREDDVDDWDMIHTSTFPGFGYVEASKSNKKFCISPANSSYVAIIEHTRHGFLYAKPESNNTRVAKQRIIDLGPDAQPILGAVATIDFIILLTKDKLYQLKVT